MPPDQLGHDPVRDVVDSEPGSVVALGRDAGVEHDLQQDVPELLAQALLVTGLESLQGLVRLLEQVRRERGVRLAGIPRAVHTQPVHGRDEVEQVRTGQVSRAMDQPGPRRKRRIGARHRQPHHHCVRHAKLGVRLVGHPVRDPCLVERRQHRVAGRREHHRGRPQCLPGGPAEQPRRHPRAGREDDQQAGAVATGDAEVVGPADRVTGLGAETTWYWL